MSDPRPLPPLPQPFAREPRPLRTGGPGCGRGVWVGCGALLLLFLVASIAVSFRADELMVWVLGRLEERVSTQLPEELTAAERQRFGDAFDELRRAVERGRVDPAALQPLQRTLFALSDDVERGLSREQVLELTEAVERAAGGPGPAASPAPSPALPGR
jgi:hypothetical protein